MIKIHGKEYITVAERVEAAHKELKTLSITTEMVPNGTQIVVKATVITPKGTFTGISAANPTKPIEKMSPYEVAETSAVGRALGFAGYGIVDGIATADEIVKAEVKAFSRPHKHLPTTIMVNGVATMGPCRICGEEPDGSGYEDLGSRDRRVTYEIEQNG